MASPTLLSLVNLSVEKYFDKEAVSFWHRNKHVRLNYSELTSHSERIKELLSNCHCHYVGLCVDVTFTFPILLYGVLKAGCAFVPLDPQNSSAWNKRIIDKLHIKYVFTNNLTLNYVSELTIAAEINVLSEDLYILDTGHVLVESVWKVPFAYSVQTSGSCGEPKVIRVPDQAIVPNIVHLSELLAVKCSDGILLGSSTTFDPCYIEVFLALTNGATLCIPGVSKLELSSFLYEAPSDITIIQTTPSLLRQLPPSSLRNLPTLRLLLLGGEECPGTAEIASWDLKNVTIYNIYGISEVSCWAAIGQVWPTPRLPLQPLQETELLINNNGSSEVAPLFIGSSTRICLLDEESFNTFDDSPVYRSTGDLFKVDDTGYIYMGRFGERVKRFGVAIDIGDLTETTMSCGAESAAVVIEQSHDSPTVHLFLSPPAKENCVKQMFYSRSRLSRPDSISSLPALPLTRHGKVDKRALKKHLTKSRDQMESEKLFVTLWENHCMSCKLEEQGFISSGGCSFSALLLVSEMKLFWSVPETFLSCLLSNQSFKEVCKQVVLMKRISNQRKRKRVEGNSDAEETRNVECLLETKWKVYLGKCVDSSPVLFGDNREYVIVGSHSGVVVIVHVDTGHVRMKVSLPDRVESTACVHPSNNMFSIGCYDSYIYTFTVDGKYEWKYKTGDSVRSGGILLNDCVVFGSYDGKLYCIECQGSLKWSASIGGAISAIPVILTEALLVATIKGVVVALCPNSGNILWSTTVSGPVFSTPLLLDKHILVADVLGHITWIQPFSGQKDGVLNLGEVNVFARLVAWQNCAVVCCSDGSLRLVTNSRKTLWRVVLDSPSIAAPCCLSEFLAVTTCRGTVHLLRSDGCIASPALKLSADVFSSPISTESSLIFGCRDDYLHCLALKNPQAWC